MTRIKPTKQLNIITSCLFFAKIFITESLEFPFLAITTVRRRITVGEGLMWAVLRFRSMQHCSLVDHLNAIKDYGYTSHLISINGDVKLQLNEIIPWHTTCYNRFGIFFVPYDGKYIFFFLSFSFIFYTFKVTSRIRSFLFAYLSLSLYLQTCVWVCDRVTWKHHLYEYS